MKSKYMLQEDMYWKNAKDALNIFAAKIVMGGV